MEYKTFKGKCNVCGNAYSQRGLSRHLKSCLQKNLSNPKAKECLYILVQYEYNHDYYFHLLLSPGATLDDLDRFLRDRWLECCGHMSAFFFDRWAEEIDKSYPVNKVLSPGDILRYDYDFGSTTELEIRCMDSIPAKMEKKTRIQVLSRNEMPFIPCDVCEKRAATKICVFCQHLDEGYFCDVCAKKHRCEDGPEFLPVVNSPRAGVCGYTGEEFADS